MLAIMDAASSAYADTGREELVIAKVADGMSDPVGWFAHSIAGIIPVFREDGDPVTYRPSIGSELQSLYIRKCDYQTYISWARALQ